MKKLLLTLALAAFALLPARAATWQTDLPKALAQAKKEKKVVLINFTGSDWCGWCIKFKKDVLDQPHFAAYAGVNLVLVEADFPNKKPQTDDLKKANAALQAKYAVGGYPTYVVLDAEGNELGRQVGYLKGGPSAFTMKIQGWKKK
jgi:protein disulfide-isomerase